MIGNKISLCRDYRLNQYRYNESLLYLLCLYNNSWILCTKTEPPKWNPPEWSHQNGITKSGVTKTELFRRQAKPNQNGATKMESPKRKPPPPKRKHRDGIGKTEPSKAERRVTPSANERYWVED